MCNLYYVQPELCVKLVQFSVTCRETRTVGLSNLKQFRQKVRDMNLPVVCCDPNNVKTNTAKVYVRYSLIQIGQSSNSAICLFSLFVKISIVLLLYIGNGRDSCSHFCFKDLERLNLNCVFR